MRYFFDTTVLVAGVLEEHEHHEPSFSALSTASRTSAFCATHNVAEVFATLTRYAGKQRLSAEQALLALPQVRVDSQSLRWKLESISLPFADLRQSVLLAARYTTD